MNNQWNLPLLRYLFNTLAILFMPYFNAVRRHP